MLFLKKICKSLLYSIISLLFINLIITLLNYLGIINIKIVNLFSYINPFISFLIGGIILGKNSNNKGYLEGLKLSIIELIFILLLNILVFNNQNLILYIITLVSTILGSMLGINIKKN